MKYSDKTQLMRFLAAVFAIALCAAITARLLFARRGGEIEYRNNRYGFAITMRREFAENLVIWEQEKNIRFFYKNRGSGGRCLGKIEALPKNHLSKNSVSLSEISQFVIYLGENQSHCFFLTHKPDFCGGLPENAEFLRSAESFVIEVALYQSPSYGISFEYPSGWMVNPGTTERISGNDGFVQISAISADNMSIDQVAENDVTHSLLPYGTEPEIRSMVIQGQPARLILPSADQSPLMRDQAGLIVRYPQAIIISDMEYNYLILWADEDHIERILETITFLP